MDGENELTGFWVVIPHLTPCCGSHQQREKIFISESSMPKDMTCARMRKYIELRNRLWQIPHQYLTKDSPIHCRHATDAICWPTLDRQENISQPRHWSILGWLSIDSRLTSRLRVNRVSADIAADILIDSRARCWPKWYIILDLFILYVFVFPVKVSGELSYPLCLFINYAYIT